MRSNGFNPTELASANTLPPGLGAAVERQRRLLGLTQQQLADLAGVGVVFLYELEHEKQTVRLDKVLDVLRTLGLELRLARGKRGLVADPREQLSELSSDQPNDPS